MNDLIFSGEGGVPLLDSDSEETKRKIAGGGDDMQQRSPVSLLRCNIT